MEAVYNNDTDEMIGFGFLSTDEMMFLFGIYHTSETVGVDRLTGIFHMNSRSQLPIQILSIHPRKLNIHF
ncbi:MAG: hypothetical protein Ct9H300mP9_5770 [Candidatus Neomarinimicrobiota bacterium]|nr:MAG: hypothetical protein Ct9H300mP9_5770 [Candidatus Neomarinimicrobiota bacterium]